MKNTRLTSGLGIAMLAAWAETAVAAPSDSSDDWQQVQTEAPSRKLLHGFRLGYLHVLDVDGPADRADPTSPSLEDKYDLRSDHMFVIGYELTWRMVGHDWLNILLVTNFAVSGLEQSKFFPSMNGLIGFEFEESFQLGVGIQVMPTREDPAHMIVAAGWTPAVGTFYTPLHFFFVPDVNGHHRMGVTVGVNW